MFRCDKHNSKWPFSHCFYLKLIFFLFCLWFPTRGILCLVSVFLGKLGLLCSFRWYLFGLFGNQCMIVRFARPPHSPLFTCLCFTRWPLTPSSAVRCFKSLWVWEFDFLILGLLACLLYCPYLSCISCSHGLDWWKPVSCTVGLRRKDFWIAC